MNASNVEMMFTALDLDGSGKIDLAEMIDGLQVRPLPPPLSPSTMTRRRRADQYFGTGAGRISGWS